MVYTADCFLNLLGEVLAMSIDQDLDTSVFHADLRSIGFQFLLCDIGVSLVFCNKELPSGLVILCFRGHERNSLLVMFGELRCSLLYFLCPLAP